MGSIFGQVFTVATFGESHGPALGVVVDGMPSGVALHAAAIQRELDRRRPGTSPFVSPRNEPDAVEVLSGVADGLTLGSPVALLIRNRDARPNDYGPLRELFRPGHADVTYFKKYGIPPQSGGGRASGRETAARVAAGAVARALLAPLGVSIRSGSVAIGGVRANVRDFDFAETHPLRFLDPARAAEAEALVRAVMAEGDSVGGVVEVEALGVPAGLGEPVFGKLDALLASAMVSIGAVKGVEFGAGFALSAMRGSEANDALTPEGFATNRAGGILGGISTGEAVLMRLAVKPTASIAILQQTVDIHGHPRTISVSGRHDPCLCPRIGPVAEAMTALALADAFLLHLAHERGRP